MTKQQSQNVNREDDAARAAGLYYSTQKTRDEIAEDMGILRPAAQRLVAKAVREGFIKFRLDHKMRHCMEMAESLAQKFNLLFCEVTLTPETCNHRGCK